MWTQSLGYLDLVLLEVAGPRSLFFFFCFPCRQMLVASVLVRVMAAVRVKGSLIRQEGDGGVSVSSIN